mgnify:CR=1 FL=1
MFHVEHWLFFFFIIDGFAPGARGRARLREVKFSFAHQKRTRKVPATFEAREARIKGFTPLIILKK